MPPHEGEWAARGAREALGINAAGPVGDLVELIEQRAGVAVFLVPLPGAIAGLAHRLDGRWYIVGDTATPAPGRLRFTLAHEFGHVWMNHEPSIDDDSTIGLRGEGHLQEVAANYFAAEFLMPRAMVDDRFGYADDVDAYLKVVTELAAAAGTTLWVPLYRLFTLDLIPNAERELLRSMVNDEVQRGVAPSFVEDTISRCSPGSIRMPAGHDERVAQLGDLVPHSRVESG